jgi:DNA-directed RNA polymerase specialized sigma24 family protein
MAFLPGPAGPKERQKECRAIHLYQGKDSIMTPATLMLADIHLCEIEPYPDGSDYSYLTTLPDPDRQPEEQVELRELRGLLLDAIETLPSRYREIGQALRIPETTAKTYFYRARKQLRSLLGSEFAYY